MMTYDVVISTVRRASLSTESADIFPCLILQMPIFVMDGERKLCDKRTGRKGKGVEFRLRSLFAFNFGGSWRASRMFRNPT
jgi:hypothetical protein